MFSTSAKTTGNGGGRVGMNAKCSAEAIKSHFCTFNEIENAMLTSGVFFSSSKTDESWFRLVGLPFPVAIIDYR